MNTTHLDDFILQEIVIDKTTVAPTALEHYEKCMICRGIAEKYLIMAQQLAKDQRPVLSLEASNKILETVSSIQRNRRSKQLLLLLCAVIPGLLGILLYLVKGYTGEVPLVAATALLIVVAMIIISEVMDHFNAHQKKLQQLQNHTINLFNS